MYIFNILGTENARRICICDLRVLFVYLVVQVMFSNRRGGRLTGPVCTYLLVRLGFWI